jgi:hypothetical protein
MKLLNKIIRLFSAGVLLALAPPSTGIAGTTGGPVYGGGGGSVDLTNVTGNINLVTPGASITVAPPAATGAGIVLSEGSEDGTSVLELKVGPDGLAGNVSCTFNVLGGLPPTCPIFKWAGPARAAVSMITMRPSGTQWDNVNSTPPGTPGTTACNAFGACYLPFKEELMNAPNVSYTAPGSTCSVGGGTDCDGALNISNTSAVTENWVISVTAEVLSPATSGLSQGECPMQVWQDNASQVIDLLIRLNEDPVASSVHAPLVTTGQTVTRDAAIALAAGATARFGVFRGGGQVPGCGNVGSIPGFDMDYVLQAVTQ